MRILVVDDEQQICSSLTGLFADEGYTVKSCTTGEEGVKLFQNERFDVVLLDVVLPGMDGIETLKSLREISPRTKVLMMSGQADLSTAVRATKLGAHNFFEKPLNPEQILLELKNLKDQIALEQRVVSLESLHGWEEEMIGNSPPMRNLKKAILKAAPSDGRVFIFGESGTGKELVARAIHRESTRRNYPFVSLNCAALPRDLVESELFGYEKGAFTGAVQRKEGRFETANGGTLFLDEVGDMNLETQAKLLRVLEENEAVRVGGNKPYHFDVRVISATNKNLEKEIEQGHFREDLFYRLNVIPLEVPPLRERKEDIPLLAHYFLQQICQRTGKGMKQWRRGAIDIFQSYSWPGNVRELRNLVERLIIMNEGEIIKAEEVEKILHASSQNFQKKNIPALGSLSLKEMMTNFEKEIIERGYQEVGGNVSKLARKLQIDRANLHRKLKFYGIK